jgi:putative aldouronate transport system substrate-binding protein
MHYPDGEAWVPATRGDKLYGFPEEGGSVDSLDTLCWIRQDWLDQLGLSLPTTVDELDETMRAFKESGLSKFGIGACNALIGWGASMDHIFGAYGVMPTVWRDYGDGRLTYGSIRPESKEVLALLRQWYQDGLMHPDFYTFGKGGSFAQFTSQEVGVYFAPHWVLSNMQAVEEENPGAKWAVTTGIKGPQGQVGRRGTNLGGRVYCFRKGIEQQKVEAVFKYLNWNIELWFNFPRYQVYQWELGIGIWKEGYDWVWGEDCELEKGTCWSRSTGAGHWIQGCMSSESTIAYYNNIEPWVNETDRSKLNRAQRLISDPKVVKRKMEIYRKDYDTRDENLLNQFVGAPGPKMVELSGQLRALEGAVYLEIVNGTRPLEDFDQFVDDWKSNGGDSVTAEVNEWYDTTK